MIPFYERITCSVPEALYALGLGRTKFYEMVAEGAITVTKVGGRTLVSVESLRRLANKGSSPPHEKRAA